MYLMCNSHDNKEFSIISHVILDFKSHLRLEYYSSFCIWIFWPKWNQTAYPILDICSSRPEELIHIVNLTKFYNKPCEVSQYMLSAVNDSHSGKTLGCFARGFLQPDHSVSFSEYSTFSSPLQYTILETPFFQPD